MNHPYFTPWTDPVSGVTSYILTERVAPVQQNFYFTTPSISPDEKRLWITCAFPPSKNKTLAVVSLDAKDPFIRHFPNAQFDTAQPMIAPDNSGVYFGAGDTIHHLDLEGRTRPVATLPADYIGNRRLTRLATHLCLSADGKHFLLDGEVGNHWFVATAEVATGKVQVIKEFIHHHNHAQFSPVDPALFTIAMDWFFDKTTGRRYHYDHRIFLMDTGDRRFESLTPHVYSKPMTGVCHEWWSADGRVCYIEYDTGVYELDLETGVHTHVWKEPLCHAHCDRTRTYWCADESPYKWTRQPCKVLFFNRRTGKVTPIASALPQPGVARGPYHIDPHPQFSPQDRWIIYTTTAREGTVDVALASVKDLIQRG